MESLMKLEPPDVTAEQRESNDLIKRIRKLRWMGMEGEAEQLQLALAGVPRADSVIAQPLETD